MSWFRVDDKLHAHRKLARAGAEAMGLWVACGSYTSSFESPDGALADDEVAGRAALLGVKRWRSLADRLVDVGLWDRTATGFKFHNWQDYLPGAEAELARRKASDRERKRAAYSSKKSTAVSSDSPRRIPRRLLENSPHLPGPSLKTPVAPLGESEPGDTTAIRLAYSMAVSRCIALPYLAPDYADQNQALDSVWLFASGAVAWPGFADWLGNAVAEWVDAARANGSTKFGWKPSRFASWLGEQAEAANNAGPVAHSWGEPSAEELGRH